MEAVEAGKNYLARTAAAFPRVLGGVSDKPLLGKKDIIGGGRAVGQVEASADGKQSETSKAAGGIVLVGSHVKKSTQQLE